MGFPVIYCASVLPDYLYYTDWRQEIIARVPKVGPDVKLDKVWQDTNQLFNVKVFSKEDQPTSCKCPLFLLPRVQNMPHYCSC